MEKSVVVLETNQGTIEIELMPGIAPKACENFISLTKKGYYDGIIFHRVIKGFMIQCGDPTGTGRGGESAWGKPFDDEFDKKASFDSPGILAMANAGPGTNGSQFFITTAKTPWLNMHHTIFGKVIAGYEVVQKIENAETGPGDVPRSRQNIVKAYIKS
ncbi:MAG: peptidylprolyl isomerase [Elusimicrobia bacterium]|nr:peptidylprolyl isomerase [Elusimicrobiota bacterium]